MWQDYGSGLIQGHVQGWSREDGFGIQEEMMTISSDAAFYWVLSKMLRGINSFNPLSSLSYMWRE